MPRARLVVSLVVLLASISVAQKAADPSTSTASCNLDDGREVYVRYVPVPDKSEKISNGKPWTPGGTPMTLFTEAPLTLGNFAIPVGAYTLYPIPGREKWTLVVSKNVTAGAALRRERRHRSRHHGYGAGEPAARQARCRLRPCRTAVHPAHLFRQERFVRRLRRQVMPSIENPS